jgi:hypothetical protein
MPHSHVFEGRCHNAEGKIVPVRIEIEAETIQDAWIKVPNALLEEGGGFIRSVRFLGHITDGMFYRVEPLKRNRNDRHVA